MEPGTLFGVMGGALLALAILCLGMFAWGRSLSDDLRTYKGLLDNANGRNREFAASYAALEAKHKALRESLGELLEGP